MNTRWIFLPLCIAALILQVGCQSSEEKAQEIIRDYVTEVDQVNRMQVSELQKSVLRKQLREDYKEQLSSVDPDKVLPW